MRILSFFAAIVIVSLAVSPAKAVTTSYDFIAYSTNPVAFGDFSLTFDDSDYDLMFSLDELTSFSGLSCSVCPTGFYDTISVVPLLATIADGSGTQWMFQIGAETVLFGGGVNWTYYVGDEFIEPENGFIIPLPAALPMFLLALAGLGFVARQRRQA